MTKIYLTVREKYVGESNVSIMRARNINKMVFSAMPDQYLEGEKAYFKLDFLYTPKGKYIGKMTGRQHVALSLNIYETSLAELKELAKLEEESLFRMTKQNKEFEKTEKELFEKNVARLNIEDIAGGEGGEYQ